VIDRIAIRGIEVDCVVGVYPHERDTPQPLRVDLESRLDTEEAAVSERLSRTVDYDFAAAQVAFLLQSCRFQLLETAAHVLARYLLAPAAPDDPPSEIESLKLRLTKPGALPGGAVPSLEIERTSKWAALGREVKGFGTVDVVHESSEVGVYRLNVGPGREIPLHVHRRMDEAEMILGEGLLCQDRPTRSGTVHRWPKDAPHSYRNPTERVQSILCVDSPPLIEEDEILVEGVPAHVPPEPLWSPRRP
jgi:dihydroneopterin aldolase